MRLRPTLLLVSAPLLLWGCSSQPVDVGLNARVGAVRAAGAPAQLEQALAAIPAGTGIDVSRVRIVVRELELEQEGDDSDDGVSVGSEVEGSHDSDDAEEFEAGPFLIDLNGAALSGSLVSLPGLQVPAGTYDEIEFEVDRLDPEEAAGSPGLTEMVEKNATVIIDGTVDGVAFSFVSGLHTEQEREARFTVDEAAGMSVTLNLDPSRWFTGTSGSRLDPRDPATKSAIEANIRASIDAFDDEDEDGAEDVDDDGSGSGSND